MTKTPSLLYPFRQSLPRNFWDYLILAVLLAGMVFFLMPIYVMVVTGLNYFANIPDELVDAARMDGAGIVRVFTHVMLPLSAPAYKARLSPDSRMRTALSA